MRMVQIRRELVSEELVRLCGNGVGCSVANRRLSWGGRLGEATLSCGRRGGKAVARPADETPHPIKGAEVWVMWAGWLNPRPTESGSRSDTKV
jgi:hypothetical protein